MGDLEYMYELRQGEEVVATGRFGRVRRLEVAERVSIDWRAGGDRARSGPCRVNESCGWWRSWCARRSGPAQASLSPASELRPDPVSKWSSFVDFSGGGGRLLNRLDLERVASRVASSLRGL